MTITDQNNSIEEFTEQLLQQIIANADADRFIAIVEETAPQDVLRLVIRLDAASQHQLIAMLTPELAAVLIEEAPAELAASLLEGVEIPVAAKIMEELQSDMQADIVHELDSEGAAAILAEMDEAEAEGVRKLVQYEHDTAGGLMEWEVFSFEMTEKVGAVLKRIASGDEDFERYRGQHPYIVDEQGKLVGVVSLRGLLTSKRTAELSDIMIKPLAVKPYQTLEELEDIFEEHPFLGVPVVNKEGIPLGVLSRSAVADALRDQQEHRSLARQQVSDELRSMPIWYRSRRRLAWLSSNIVLNIIAASVISAYEETLTAVIAIAVFLPMVSDMSGCSGNQAVGVSMRELALGLTKPTDLFHVLKKEFSVGIINGVILGIMIGMVAWLWKDNAVLGLVIGLALSVNTVLAVAIGGTVPLLLKGFGIDPAVASGPLLTTITDMAGFFLVLSLATLFMPLLL
ncbi:MAG: magnesium transporter [Pseudomonadota bacterium]|nr:magnesium transporter [Pseudomonadota bacterium]MDO7710752.1 magnesium transporter [Pseudomonadota bacterium]